MENLINFEENGSNNNNIKESSKPQKKQLKHQLIINDRLSLELNNPFDKLEYRITHRDDPFECLETRNLICSENAEK